MLTVLLVALLAAGFSGQAAATPPPPATTVQDPALSPKPDPWPPVGVLRMGSGIESPKVLRDIKPNYTADAMRAKIQGSVELEAVVLVDGTVGEVIVSRSLDKEHGLDRSAIAAMKKWRFTPASKGGTVIPVVVTVEMSFWLRDKR
jgi:protein TonB